MRFHFATRPHKFPALGFREIPQTASDISSAAALPGTAFSLYIATDMVETPPVLLPHTFFAVVQKSAAFPSHHPVHGVHEHARSQNSCTDLQGLFSVPVANFLASFNVSTAFRSKVRL